MSSSDFHASQVKCRKDMRTCLQIAISPGSMLPNFRGCSLSTQCSGSLSSFARSAAELSDHDSSVSDSESINCRDIHKQELKAAIGRLCLAEIATACLSRSLMRRPWPTCFAAGDSTQHCQPASPPAPSRAGPEKQCQSPGLHTGFWPVRSVDILLS